MWTALAILVLIAAFTAAFAIKAESSNLSAVLSPYYSKKPLTLTEAEFYRRLVQALPDCTVLAQVQLSRFLNVDRIKAGKDYLPYFNAIAQQSVDYLVCLNDFTIVAAIELDDKTHHSDAAKKRDAKKTRNLKAADVPLIRWHAETMPTIEEIRAAFTQDKEDALTNPVQVQWALEDQEDYFRRNPTPSSLVAKILMPIAMKLLLGLGIIVAALIAFNLIQKQAVQGVQTLVTLPQQIITPGIKHIQEQQAQLQQSSLEKFRLQQQMEEAKKQEALAAQQAHQQQEFEALQLAAAKEKAWQAYYRQSQECRTTGNLITCGNEYAKAKREFEAKWKASAENIDTVRQPTLR